MAFVPAILLTLGVTTGVEIRGVNTDPQSMTELTENYEFQQPNPPFTWVQYCQKRDEIHREKGNIRLRKFRTAELANTDWVEVPTNMRTIENIDELLTYRQMLRDLPTTVTTFEWVFTGGLPQLDLRGMGVPPRPAVVRKTS